MRATLVCIQEFYRCIAFNQSPRMSLLEYQDLCHPQFERWYHYDDFVEDMNDEIDTVYVDIWCLYYMVIEYFNMHKDVPDDCLTPDCTFLLVE